MGKHVRRTQSQRDARNRKPGKTNPIRIITKGSSKRRRETDNSKERNPKKLAKARAKEKGKGKAMAKMIEKGRPRRIRNQTLPKKLAKKKKKQTPPKKMEKKKKKKKKKKS